MQMNPVATAPTPASKLTSFDFPGLEKGVMMVKDHTPTKIPPFPPMYGIGNAWVVATSPTSFRVREKDFVDPGLPVHLKLPSTFDQTVEILSPGVVGYSVTGTLLGVPLPHFSRTYDVVDAGKGWIQLRTQGKPNERPSTISTLNNTFSVDFIGPLNSVHKKSEPFVLPSDPKYIAPPAGWLESGAAAAANG